MSDKSNNKPNFKQTVNLPKTDFPIRASLKIKEPELLEFWKQNQIYEKIQEKNQYYDKSYILHDGPPYPNGPIHMGHALNKILKDIVIRSKTMQGFQSPYIPGWDCHGLPIETQVIKELQSGENITHNIENFRNRCQEFSLNYVENQKKEFIKLGIFGQWSKPYLTLSHQYEAGVIKNFGKIAEESLIYQGKKPIHWCKSCKTALAEAEIEYQNHRSPSIYIRFEVKHASDKLQELIDSKPINILVWTTTPWTLPANVAIATHPEFTYLIGKTNNTYYLFLKELKETLIEKLSFTNFEIIAEIKGSELSGTVTKHPFIDRTSPVITASYITKEDGTGFVHIAPGHGQEDYITGLEHNLPMIMPIDDQGKFTEEVPNLKGISVFDANKIICQEMEQKGTLLKLEFIKHSYPHCWRCKNPVIFRATKQWFIAMDKPLTSTKKTLRETALKTIRETTWYPSWGEKRLTSMIENRPDWCLSRQRYWGIPLPIFICKKCGHQEMTGEFNTAVVNLVKEKGANAWFTTPADQILPQHLSCSKCNSKEFTKEKDILDVWFESGSSFTSVLTQTNNLSFPAQLYLEGSDQHRGWFQSSLLIGIATNQKAPYNAVLTHGFICDDKGRKMSKSQGNVISPQEVINEFGADILRWWVASSDFKSSDINIAPAILKQARDSFAKIRNTIRFLLSNLYDFNLKTDFIIYEQQEEIDQWILGKLNELIQNITKSYNKFEFHQVTHKIHDFCAVTLSSLYLDMLKDRLYCDGKKSKTRKSAQTSIHLILKTLLPLIAPILVFTAEDAYSYFNLSEKEKSIHLCNFPKPQKKYENLELMTKWDQLLKIKDLVYQELEQLRNQKEIKSFLEAKIDLTLPKPIDFNSWELLFIVSQVNISLGKTLKVSASKAEGEKCERCWKYAPLTNYLCPRCQKVIK